jgi:hypothetical protein
MASGVLQFSSETTHGTTFDRPAPWVSARGNTREDGRKKRERERETQKEVLFIDNQEMTEGR